MLIYFVRVRNGCNSERGLRYQASLGTLERWIAYETNRVQTGYILLLAMLLRMYRI